MRTALLTIAAAVSALAFASPASAQYFPAPYGYAYGYHGNYGQVRMLQARIDHLQRQINRLDRRDVLSEREARRLRRESIELEHRLRVASRFGLHPGERYDLERRLARLERRLWIDANDGRRWAYYPGPWY